MLRQVITILLLFPALLVSQYKNIKINSIENRPNEVTIAINPNHPNNIIAGANLNNYYYSFDKGETWVNKTISSDKHGVWGDPVVIFDLNGRAYYFHLSKPKEGTWIDRIVCQRSNDGGMTWEDPGTAMGLNPPNKQDKEWACADISGGERKNYIYVTWTQFEAYDSRRPEDSSNIMFSFSSNGGDSWSTARKISQFSGDCVDSSNSTEGAVPCVGPGGELYVSWSLNNRIYFDRSLDGGSTWLDNDIVAAEQPGGWAFDIPDIYRCNGMPITACDVSSSPYRGTLYINFSDIRNGKDNTDIFLIKSTDGGESWSDALRVNDDPADGRKMQFMSWMHVDPLSGAINIIFYDRRNFDDSRTEVVLARSTDGGSTFSNTVISESPFNPVSGVFFGDYIGINSYNDFVACIWQRLDKYNISIQYCGIDFKKQ